jgi:hypothetical protein
MDIHRKVDRGGVFLLERGLASTFATGPSLARISLLSSGLCDGSAGQGGTASSKSGIGKGSKTWLPGRGAVASTRGPRACLETTGVAAPEHAAARPGR